MAKGVACLGHANPLAFERARVMVLMRYEGRGVGVPRL
jgi:hypothetical protein